jgi:hypothetical protein
MNKDSPEGRPVQFTETIEKIPFVNDIIIIQASCLNLFPFLKLNLNDL